MVRLGNHNRNGYLGFGVGPNGHYRFGFSSFGMGRSNSLLYYKKQTMGEA